MPVWEALGSDDASDGNGGVLPPEGFWAPFEDVFLSFVQWTVKVE